MTKVDQFESLFRSAAKQPYRHRRPRIARVLVVTDLEGDEARGFLATVRAMLAVLEPDAASPERPTWTLVEGHEFATERALLDLVEAHRPDLCVTYRHLHSEGWRWHFSLGEHLDVLVNATTTPVLVLPHPRAGAAAGHAMQDTNRVLVVTDHLTGDDLLVGWGAALTLTGGTLVLGHVEDARTFARYLEAISKIPSIDTENARERLAERLLKEPRDYIESCVEGLRAARPDLRVLPEVRFGRMLADYERRVAELEVDLVVFPARDEDQVAMHGLSYPLAVDLRQVPLLLL
ncbi:MAG: hypothetical protein R3F30_16125 [Planctomycetota bacterium]